MRSGAVFFGIAVEERDAYSVLAPVTAAGIPMVCTSPLR